MEITNNAARLARLLDEAAIRDAIARFADAATSGDSNDFRTLWADDAEWVIGSAEGQPFESRSKGIEEIVSHFRHLRDGKDYFVQFAAPGSIGISGDDATVRCLCYEAGRGPGQYYRNTGIDTVRLQRSDNGWVFTSRSYKYMWLDFSPFSGAIFQA